jgi:phage/plasmid-like protein (TIGR03299 family)
MSRETAAWLNQNTLIGFTDKRGTAWHYRASEQDTEPNHYAGPVPVADVHRRLFSWDAVSVPMGADLSGLLDSPGAWKVLPGRQVILRSDTGADLGVFRDGYEIHNFGPWLLERVADILDDELSIGSAGLLKGGAQAWVSVEVPDTITTPEGVQFRPNLLACTSHDGSLATTFKRVVTNVVCDNTMAAGLAEAGQQYKIKHSRYSPRRIQDMRTALDIVHSVADDFAAEVRALCSTTVTDRAWSAFLDAHLPIADVTGRTLTGRTTERQELTRLWNTDNRVSPWRNTAWGVVQAVNTYAHHHAIVRNASRVERNMTNAVTGKVDTLDQTTARTLTKVLTTV